MKFLAVLPSIHPPSTEECVETMGADLLGNLLLVDNASGNNRGVAASWNIAAMTVLALRLDWLVVVSAATRFGADRGNRFLQALADRPDAWVVESNDYMAHENNTVGWHLIGWHRNVLERVGLFDENFWPAYGEDGDISHRVNVARREDHRADLHDEKWTSVESGARITMQGHGVKLANVDIPSDLIWRYYVEKWGGMPGGREAYVRPFADPDLPLSFWPTPPDPRSIIDQYDREAVGG